MNIGQLAAQASVSPDTLRYYEKQGLLDAPTRQANGYRRYGDADLARVRFVRSAQALGFTLAEIRDVLPALAQGRLDRAALEGLLQDKLAEIESHMRRLRGLRRELQGTLASLQCAPGTPVSTPQATAASAPPRQAGAVPVPPRRGARRGGPTGRA